MKNAFELVSSVKGLRAAWEGKQKQLIHSCFGADRVSGKSFKNALSGKLPALSEQIRSGYKTLGLLAIPKPKDGGGYRIICVPSVADRLVQFSILDQLRPRLKKAGLDNPISYGLAPTRGRSVIGARDFACKARSEHGWVYKTDINKFFDNLDRQLLRKAVETAAPQRSLWPLIQTFLDAEIVDGIEPGWKKVVSDAGIKPGLGVRQGMPLSPFFAGAYLKNLDRWLLKQSAPAARYVDDIVVFFDSEKAARAFHPKIAQQLRAIGLTIGELDEPTSKTKLYAPDEPADFLGMEIKRVAETYRLCVSSKTTQKVGEKLAKLSSVSAMDQQNVQLTTLGSFLHALKRGYMNAYDGAHNLSNFEAELETYCEGAKQTVLLEIFGDKLEGMTEMHRKFVGLE